MRADLSAYQDLTSEPKIHNSSFATHTTFFPRTVQRASHGSEPFASYLEPWRLPLLPPKLIPISSKAAYELLELSQ